MQYNPADKTHRKPSRIRNTPLAKYVHYISLGVTLLYVGAMYISFRRNVLPYINDEECNKMIEDLKRRDSLEFPTFIDKISAELPWGKSAAHAESKDVQSD